MFSRRAICLWVAFMMAGFAPLMTRTAQAATIDVISEIIQSAGSIIKSIADGIEAAYKTGTFVIDDQKARRSRDSLRAIQSLNTSLVVGQATLLWQIENYNLGSNGHWIELQSQIARVAFLIQSAASLLDELAPDLPPAQSIQISRLASVYAKPSSLIEEIRSIPAPQTQADLDALRDLGARWTILHDQLVHLNAVLDARLPAP